MMKTLQNYINGQWVDAAWSGRGLGVSPADQDDVLAELEIGFFGRHEGAIRRVAFRDVEFPKSGEHLFQFMDEGGQHRRVPFHRIRELSRDGERIWHRHAGGAKAGDNGL